MSLKKNKNLYIRLLGIFFLAAVYITIFTNNVFSEETDKNQQENINPPDNASKITSPPFKGKDEIDLKEGLIKSVKGLAVCILLLFLILFITKKFQTLNKSTYSSKKRLKILDKIFINSKASIAVIEFEGEEILCGITNENITFFKNERKKISFDDVIKESTEKIES